ncbi:hypothetical protein, partial [Actinophytocola sp.]|uniref:hypothetical protein n=1 Tax=Actinophytocola sp. TaxID=1872138 RepID=UPI003D6C3E85
APARRGTERSNGRSRSAAARRAYARRAHREGRPADRVELDEDHAAGRASFVILIIALLAVGVAATLWLSTQAIADSYRLEDAKQTADQLAERADQLQRDVTKAESASALAERAKAMGMVPAGDPARLVVRPDGRVVVVGEPTRAEKPKPPASQTRRPATPPPGQPGDTRPGGRQPGDQADGQQPGGQEEAPRRQAANTPGAG